MNPEEKLAVARLIVADRFAYFTQAVLGMVYRPAPGMGTMGVSKSGVCYYDPETIDKWTQGQVAMVLMHEVQHLMRDHHGRQQSMAADAQLFNIAGDCELNDDLLEAVNHIYASASGVPQDPAVRIEFPTHAKMPASRKAMGSAIFPGDFGMSDGLTAEEYYHLLRQQAQKCPSKPGPGWCGSGAGNPLPGEPNEEGRSEADLVRIRQEVAQATKTAAAKNPGSVPAEWARWADQQLKPSVVPWQKKLARACRAALSHRKGMVDYRYAIPPRRQWGVGVGPGKPILPGLFAPIPSVAVAVDTSGSMGEVELVRAVSEAKAILSAAGSSVTLIACDAEVHTHRKVRDWRQVGSLLKGGGGTSFIPIFEELDRRANPRPDVVVVCTDGYGPAPEAPPRGMHVIWLLVGGTKPPAPWGEAVVVDEGTS